MGSLLPAKDTQGPQGRNQQEGGQGAQVKSGEKWHKVNRTSQRKQRSEHWPQNSSGAGSEEFQGDCFLAPGEKGGHSAQGHARARTGHWPPPASRVNQRQSQIEGSRADKCLLPLPQEKGKEGKRNKDVTHCKWLDF
nr:uncharacterized protein LOC103888811 [Pongo abelii]